MFRYLLLRPYYGKSIFLFFGLIDVAKSKRQEYGTDTNYEFSHKHQVRRPPRRVDDLPETTHAPSIHGYYRNDMTNVLDRLVTEFHDVEKSVKGVAQPFICLLPNCIREATEEDVNKLCRLFPRYLRDADSLKAEIDLLSNDMAKTVWKTTCGQRQRQYAENGSYIPMRAKFINYL